MTAESSRADAVRRTLPSHFVEKSPLTDTAGVSWAGRDYSVSPFPDDDGSCPPAVAAALEAARTDADPDHRGLAGALRGTRVLVPIMATATEKGITAHGLTGDNGADMAMAILEGADGSRALPLFTSTAALAAWRTDARPVPVVIEQAAQAAVQEECTSLLLDPGADPAAPPIVLQRSILWALAQGRAWVPPHDDDEVRAELGRLLPSVPQIIGLTPVAGASAELELRLRLVPGLDAEQVRGVVAVFSQALGSSELIAERVSSVRMALVP